MKRIKNNYQLALACLVAVGLSVVTVTPSFAFDIKDFFSSLISDAKSSFSKLEASAQTQIDLAWAGMSEDAKTAITDSIGSMGTVDSVSSSEALKKKLRESRSLPDAKATGQELERELTRSSVSAVISKSGQDDTTKKLETAQQIAEQAKSLGDTAQDMDASQNILKVIAAQNALVVSMLAQQRSDIATARFDTAQSNLMLSQVADNIAANRERDNIFLMGQASLTQEVIGMSVLDPAYNK